MPTESTELRKKTEIVVMLRTKCISDDGGATSDIVRHINKTKRIQLILRILNHKKKVLKYGVPRNTLYDRLSGRIAEGKQ